MTASLPTLAWRSLAAAAIGLVGAAGAEAASPAGAERPECRAVADGPDRIRAIDPDGSVVLETGRRARLVDVRLPGDPNRAAAALAGFAGAEARVGILGPPDRWGRSPATVTAGGVDLSELLVGEGFAVLDTGPRGTLCRDDLRPIEAAARRRAAGLWTTEAWPIRSNDLDRLGKLAGRFAVVEGVLSSVGERRERTYLNFGRDWSRDFNVTIPRRLWAEMKALGMTAASLGGRRVRVRGSIEMRTTPTLELASADMLEVVDRPEALTATP